MQAGLAAEAFELLCFIMLTVTFGCAIANAEIFGAILFIFLYC